MMAKMFYTLDEAKAALNKSEEDIKQLAREGRLREFRDGPRLMFKADQVEALRAEMGGGGAAGGDQVDLGVSDTGAPIGLVDSRGASGSATGISLTDSRSGSGSGMSGLMSKQDSGLAADLGLTGSATGMPSPGRTGSGGSGSGLSSTGSRGGVNVLADSEAGADPMAQTAINPAVNEQVNLEGVGSGSGLLDLTRESDDTSLGAELLDEITPGGSGSRRGSPEATIAATAAGAPAMGQRRGGVSAPMYIEAPDAMAPAFGWMAAAGAIMLAFAGLAITSAVLGTRPGLIEMTVKSTFLIMAAAGVGLAVIFFIVGLVVGKSVR
jgi:hypothetical protein